jgi:hypothetical protein
MANCKFTDPNEGFFTGLRDKLRARAAAPMTALEKRRKSDRLRTVLQPPIAAPRYRVIYLAHGRERKSAWLYNSDHARAGLQMMQAKYGQRNAVIYVD